MDIEVRALEKAAAMGYAVEPAGVTNFPPVDVVPIYDREGAEISGYQRIFRTDTGQTLAIHTGTYEMRPYHESFAQLEAAIAQSSLDQRGLMTRTEFSHDGARCFRSYLFPHVGIEVRSGDFISLQILAFDSYDGSYATSIAAGGFRHICLNGSFFGKTIQRLKVRHVKGAAARFDNALEKVVHAAETFTRMAPRLRSWAETAIDIREFKLLLRALPQITEPLADHLMARFALELEPGQATLYDVWNILTAWASREGGTAQSRTDRDRRVASLIESGAWHRLEHV